MKKELTLYGIFGILTTVIGVGVFAVLSQMGFHFILANAISFVLAVAFAYVTNKKWVFESNTPDTRAAVRELVDFFQSRIATFILETFGLFILIEWLHVGDTVSKLFCNGVVIVLNYVLSKYFVFGEEHHNMPKRSSKWLAVLILTFVGAWLRWLWITKIPTQQLYDFQTYYDIARNIYNGLGYTFEGKAIAFQGMGYSYSLGLVFKLIGSDSELVAKCYNLVLSTATIPLVYHLGGRFGLKTPTRFVVTALCALLPQQISYCNAIGTEVLSQFLLALTLSVQTSLRLVEKFKWPLVGVLTGAMTLVKPFYMAFWAVIALGLWLQTKDVKKTLRAGLLVWLCMWLVIAPWTYRNYKEFGRFIPVSYNSGLVLYLNNNASNVHGGFMPLDKIAKTPEFAAKIDAHLEYGNKSLKNASDIELDLGPAAKQWIKENPREFLKLAVIRVHSTFFNNTWDVEAWNMNKFGATQTKWTPVGYDRLMHFVRAVNDIAFMVMASASLLWCIIKGFPMLLGAFQKRRRYSVGRIVPILNMGFVVAVCFVYEGQPRYNYPVIFLMLLMMGMVMESIASAVDHEDSDDQVDDKVV